MSPTWLEAAVAVLLLWLAWRIGLMLTPWVINRWRARRERGGVTPERRGLLLRDGKVKDDGSKL